MTAQEAIEILERHKNFQFGDKKYGGGITVPEIIELLKKQVPQKPDMEFEDSGLCYKISCPKCNTFLGRIGKYMSSIHYGLKPVYCDCGQALDWSEIDPSKLQV